MKKVAKKENKSLKEVRSLPAGHFRTRVPLKKLSFSLKEDSYL